MEFTIRFKLLNAVLAVLWLAILLTFVYFTWGFITIDKAVKAFYVMLSLTVLWFIMGCAGFAWSRIKSSRT